MIQLSATLVEKSRIECNRLTCGGRGAEDMKEEKATRELIKNRWNTLSKELKVAVKIQEMNDADEIPYFNIVAKKFSPEEMSSTTVHNAIDRLIDLGTISADWHLIGSKWVRRFYISGESKDFIDKLIKELYK